MKAMPVSTIKSAVLPACAVVLGAFPSRARAQLNVTTEISVSTTARRMFDNLETLSRAGGTDGSHRLNEFYDQSCGARAARSVYFGPNYGGYGRGYGAPYPAPGDPRAPYSNYWNPGYGRSPYSTVPFPYLPSPAPYNPRPSWGDAVANGLQQFVNSIQTGIDNARYAVGRWIEPPSPYVTQHAYVPDGYGRNIDIPTFRYIPGSIDVRGLPGYGNIPGTRYWPGYGNWPFVPPDDGGSRGTFGYPGYRYVPDYGYAPDFGPMDGFRFVPGRGIVP